MYVIDDFINSLYALLHAISQALDVPLFGPVTFKTVTLVILMFVFIKEAVQHAMERVVDSAKGAEALSTFISLLLCFEYIAITTSLPKIVVNVVAYIASLALLSSLLFSFLDEIALFKEGINWSIAIALSLMFIIGSDVVKMLVFIMNSLPFLLALISFSLLFFLKKENWGFVVSAFIIGSLLVPPSYFLFSFILFSLLFMTLIVMPLHHKMYSIRVVNRFQKKGEGLRIASRFKIISKEMEYFLLSLIYSIVSLSSFMYIQTGSMFKAIVYGGSSGVAITLISLLWEFMLIHRVKEGSIEAISRDIEEYKKVIKELETRRDKEENIEIKTKYNKWIENINTKIKELEDKKAKIIRGEA